MTPYEEALQWINHHPGTDAAHGMVKLLLSLSNNTYAFALRECTAEMDEFALAVALRVVSHYVRIGNEYDQQLDAIATILSERHPRLNEIAEAWVKVRVELMEKWKHEDATDPPDLNDDQGHG
jgi:hypothetical protein